MEIETPIRKAEIIDLNVGDVVYLSGTVVTARDMAHKRALIQRKFPCAIEDIPIFHSGPIVERINDEWRIVSIGPTTSSRMNSLEVEFIERFRIKAVVGKGGMDSRVKNAMKNRAVYLAMTGGCGALYTKYIKKVRDVYWLDLGIPEAVWVLEVEKFGPLIVGIDSKGNSLYEEMENKIRRNLEMILND
ncbi:MAG: fumarate hydratase [Candidatus Altiarchaeales archaeon]|nr:MAG: fumarate hydratase [Candidatus Altiarchaeales archaeon]RLI94240.1 MAG: fumarate hydratase [Candidatus Altiarchaeales archaeon]